MAIKIYCRWCHQHKHGHRVSPKNIHQYEDGIGSELWYTYRVKIHKHHKGQRHCQGSDKIVNFIEET